MYLHHEGQNRANALTALESPKMVPRWASRGRRELSSTGFRRKLAGAPAASNILTYNKDRIHRQGLRRQAHREAAANGERVHARARRKSPNIFFGRRGTSEAAIDGALFGCLSIRESCSGGSRILVPEVDLQEFVPPCGEAKNISWGAPLDRDNQDGALWSARNNMTACVSLPGFGKKERSWRQAAAVRKSSHKGYYGRTETSFTTSIYPRRIASRGNLLSCCHGSISFGRRERTRLKIANDTPYGTGRRRLDARISKRFPRREVAAREHRLE